MVSMQTEMQCVVWDVSIMGDDSETFVLVFIRLIWYMSIVDFRGMLYLIPQQSRQRSAYTRRGSAPCIRS